MAGTVAYVAFGVVVAVLGGILASEGARSRDSLTGVLLVGFGVASVAMLVALPAAAFLVGRT
jgi:hypothetical protein